MFLADACLTIEVRGLFCECLPVVVPDTHWTQLHGAAISWTAMATNSRSRRPAKLSYGAGLNILTRVFLSHSQRRYETVETQKIYPNQTEAIHRVQITYYRIHPM